MDIIPDKIIPDKKPQVKAKAKAPAPNQPVPPQHGFDVWGAIHHGFDAAGNAAGNGLHAGINAAGSGLKLFGLLGAAIPEVVQAGIDDATKDVKGPDGKIIPEARFKQLQKTIYNHGDWKKGLENSLKDFTPFSKSENDFSAAHGDPDGKWLQKHPVQSLILQTGAMAIGPDMFGDVAGTVGRNVKNIPKVVHGIQSAAERIPLGLHKQFDNLAGLKRVVSVEKHDQLTHDITSYLGRNSALNKHAYDMTHKFLGNTTNSEARFVQAIAEGSNANTAKKVLNLNLTAEREAELHAKGLGLREYLADLTTRQIQAGAMADKRIYGIHPLNQQLGEKAGMYDSPDVQNEEKFFFPMSAAHNLPQQTARDADVEKWVADNRGATSGKAFMGRKGTAAVNGGHKKFNGVIDATVNGALRDDYEPAQNLFKHINQREGNIEAENFFNAMKAKYPELISDTNFVGAVPDKNGVINSLGSGKAGYEKAVKYYTARNNLLKASGGVPQNTVSELVAKAARRPDGSQLLNTKDEAALQQGVEALKHTSVHPEMVDYLNNQRNLMHSKILSKIPVAGKPIQQYNTISKMAIVSNPLFHPNNMAQQYFAEGGKIGVSMADGPEKQFYEKLLHDSGQSGMAPYGANARDIAKTTRPLNAVNAVGKSIRAAGNANNNFVFDNVEHNFKINLLKKFMTEDKLKPEVALEKVRNIFGNSFNVSALSHLGLMNFEGWTRAMVKSQILNPRAWAKYSEWNSAIKNYNEQNGDPQYAVTHKDGTPNLQAPGTLYVGNLPWAKEQGIQYIGLHSVGNSAHKFIENPVAGVVNRASGVMSIGKDWYDTEQQPAKEPGENINFHTVYNKDLPAPEKALQAAEFVGRQLWAPTGGAVSKIIKHPLAGALEATGNTVPKAKPDTTAEYAREYKLQRRLEARINRIKDEDKKNELIHILNRRIHEMRQAHGFED